MNIETLVSKDAIALDVEAHSKKNVIQEISALAAKVTGLPERAIFDTLLQRERLGSTGIGNGIAIPHGKLVELKSLKGLFFRLASPVNFDALDDKPVDLVFALLAPEDAGSDHLKALARIARILRMPNMVDELREAETRNEVYGLLTRTPVNAS